MKQPEVNLCITQGDEKAYNLTFSDGAGAIDITGATVTMTVKRSKSDITPAFPAKIVTTHADPTQGKTVIVLSESDTSIGLGNYYYDIEIKGNTIAKKTVVKGKLEITWQVTE
jgi:hypothetical protein